MVSAPVSFDYWNVLVLTLIRRRALASSEKTAFASAERAAVESVTSDYAFFARKDLVESAIDTVPDVFLILNRQRQIVYANRAFLEVIGLDACEDIKGLRPGEALKCSNADKAPGGCGTSEFCRHCGAVNAILLSHKGERATRECRITRKDTGEALDFSVLAVPLVERGDVFTVLALKDISHEKRRRALERVFFHDILNTLGGLFGLSNRLGKNQSPEVKRLVHSVKDSARLLLDEIKAQKELSLAENGTLKVRRSKLNSDDFIYSLIANYQNHAVCKGRHLRKDPDSDSFTFQSDQTLLNRVVGNMIKNALEAIDPERTVTVRARKLEDGVEFSVHNPGVMPRNVQLQVFQRSFSTKGDDRGLGTYSMKLFGEKYLLGDVSFETAEESGTVFRIRLPEKSAKTVKKGNRANHSVSLVETTTTFSKEESHLANVENAVVSADGVRDPDELLVTLEKLMVENYSDTRDSLMMLGIGEFADKLGEAGRKHNVDALIELSNALQDQVDAFEVETLPATLELFPGLLKKLRKVLTPPSE